MKYNFITIEREYGSGGTKIARRLAEVCGVPCYGQEILESVAERLNLPAENISKYEEKASSSLLYTIALLGQTGAGKAASLPTEEKLLLEEQDEIRKMADRGHAVFLGHCAFEALKQRKGVLKVFIHADEKKKRERIIQDYGIEPAQVERVRKQFDKKRANYYFANTSKRWMDFKNYDVVLNSSDLGIDGCVAALCALLKHGENRD